MLVTTVTLHLRIILTELGRAGCNRDASFENYSYNIYTSIEWFIYVYERIHDPREKILDEKYRKEQVDDLMEVAKLLGSTSRCYFEEIDTLLGNPASDLSTVGQCNNCPNCRGENIFGKSLYRDGICELLMKLFVIRKHKIRD